MGETIKRTLTVGYRARIKPASDQEGRDMIRKWYANHEVLLTERSSGEFACIVLKKGTNVPLIRDANIVIDEVAWLSPEELEFVDDNVEANIDFIDWYKENEENFCPHCDNFCGEDATNCPKCDCDLGEE